MALDIIGIILILLFFIRGYMKGIIVAVFSLLAILLGIICSLKLSGMLAAWFLEKGYITSGWGQVVSYVIIFTAVFLLVRLVAKAIESVTRAVALGWLNKITGGLLYAFTALVIWSSVLWLLTETQLLKPETIITSRTYPYFIDIAPIIFDKIGEVWPMVKNTFADLRVFFEDLNKTGHVGTH